MNLRSARASVHEPNVYTYTHKKTITYQIRKSYMLPYFNNIMSTQPSAPKNNQIAHSEDELEPLEIPYSEPLSPNTPAPILPSDDEVEILNSPENQLGIIPETPPRLRLENPMARRLVMLSSPELVESRRSDAGYLIPSDDSQHEMFSRINANTRVWANRKWTTVQWTIHNYSPYCVELLEKNFADLTDDGSVQYVCFGKEVCPSTYRPHLQGYTRFPKTPAGSQVRWLQKRIFLSLLQVDQHCCWPSLNPADGGDEALAGYCSKTRPQDATPNEYFREWGTMDRKRKRGSRMDIHDAAEFIVANACKMSRLELYRKFPKLFFKYNRAMDRLIEESRLTAVDTRLDGIHIFWYFGVTGAGKSAAVFSETENARVFRKGAGKWWDGMDAERVVILDDYRKNWMTFGELLRILDKYPYRGERKGGYSRLMADVFYITCPLHPAHAKMYGHLDGNEGASGVLQLLHRIYKRGNGKIIEFIYDEDSEERSMKCWSYADSKALALESIASSVHNGGSNATASNFVLPYAHSMNNNNNYLE